MPNWDITSSALTRPHETKNRMQPWKTPGPWSLGEHPRHGKCVDEQKNWMIPSNPKTKKHPSWKKPLGGEAATDLRNWGSIDLNEDLKKRCILRCIRPCWKRPPTLVNMYVPEINELGTRTLQGRTRRLPLHSLAPMLQEWVPGRSRNMAYVPSCGASCPAGDLDLLLYTSNYS